MSPRTDDCIVYLPTGNRTGSVKKLSIATNKIILRDNFKVLPMPASVILQLKALAAKDGRFLSRIPNVYDEIQYMHSVNKSQVLRFMPIAPPNAEQRIRAASREVPVSIEMHQLVLADTPPVEIVEDIIPSEIGGVTTVSENILELRPEGSDRTSPTVMHDAEQGISQHSTDISTDSVSPDSVLEQHLSPSFPTPTTVNTTTDEHVERNSQEQVIDYFRTGNGILKRPSEQGATFVTFNTPVVTSPTQRVSCTESITAVLTKRKSKLQAEPSANVSVREALRTRGNDARLVINKELRQMIDKKVWAPVLYNRLTAGERSCIIRSSMFMKRKAHPDRRFVITNQDWLQEAISSTRTFTMTCPPQQCQRVQCLRSQRCARTNRGMQLW